MRLTYAEPHVVLDASVQLGPADRTVITVCIKLLRATPTALLLSCSFLVYSRLRHAEGKS